MSNILHPLRRIAQACALCLPALFLSACGGGGGGDSSTSGSTSGSTSTAPAVAITSTNAKAVAANAVEVTADGEYATGASALVLGAQVDSGAEVGAVRLASIARRMVTLTPAAPSLATGVAIDQSTACPSGGTLSISGNVSDSGTGISAGDTVTYTAAGCKMDPYSTLNGKMTITFHTDLSAASTFPFRMSMSFTIENFTVSDSSGSETINGDMRMDVSASSSTSETITVSGAALTSGNSKLFNYSVSVSESGGVTTQTVSGTVETTSSHLGGSAVSYQVSTLTPMTYTASGVTGGVVKVTGNGSALLITVTALNSFKLEVDANGDGTYEATLTTTRTELEALL